ncbi:hypothetical protein AWB61_05355 [Chromobacterium sp. F49]|nr:hypothetical protein Cv017_22590 [Chromobacterium subtsugae]KZE84127.1 hypothetical protein AWB61_05355 [Chromobacterium sp. F49]
MGLVTPPENPAMPVKNRKHRILLLSSLLALCLIGQILSYRTVNLSSLCAGAIIGILIAQLSAELDALRAV